MILYSSSAKTLLAEYLFNEELKKLFQSRPHIEFYLNAGDRKNYNNYIHKGKPQKQLTPTPIFLSGPNPAFQPQFYSPFPPQNMPSYMPRPNQK
jgi:hypothetical protein